MFFIFKYIEEKFDIIITNDLLISDINQLHNFQKLAHFFKVELSFKNCQSFYILNREKINAKIIINKQKTNKKQFKEFYHELTHHLLHAFHCEKNEYQANISCLFLMIPHSMLKRKLEQDNYDINIEEYAEYFNVTEKDMNDRLVHFKENLIHTERI